MTEYRYDRNLALDMWAGGTVARVIADELVSRGADENITANVIKHLIIRARGQKDPRAAPHGRGGYKGRGRSSNWPDAAIAKLRELWGNTSSAEIVVALRHLPNVGRTFTRNAVIGKAHRLKLPPIMPTPKAYRPRGTVRPPPRARQVVGPCIGRKPLRPPNPYRRVLLAPSIPPPEARMLSLLDLEGSDCRFIIGELKEGGGYCGARVSEGTSWCPYHLRIVYRAPELRRRAWIQRQPSEVSFSG